MDAATSTTRSNTDKLAALIAAKLRLVELLARLGRRQLELIDGGEMTDLVKLLAAKQTVLDELQAADRQLAPFRQEDPEHRVWRSPAERAACQAQADRCNALLSEAMDLERRAEAAMLQRRSAAAATLEEVHAVANAHAAYAHSAFPATTLRAEG